MKYLVFLLGIFGLGFIASVNSETENLIEETESQIIQRTIELDGKERYALLEEWSRQHRPMMYEAVNSYVRAVEKGDYRALKIAVDGLDLDKPQLPFKRLLSKPCLIQLLLWHEIIYIKQFLLLLNEPIARSKGEKTINAYSIAVADILKTDSAYLLLKRRMHLLSLILKFLESHVPKSANADLIEKLSTIVSKFVEDKTIPSYDDYLTLDRMRTNMMYKKHMKSIKLGKVKLKVQTKYGLVDGPTANYIIEKDDGFATTFGIDIQEGVPAILGPRFVFVPQFASLKDILMHFAKTQDMLGFGHAGG